MEDTLPDLELQALEDEKRRHANAMLKIQQDFDKGKKRTCPRCGVTFLTRKDRRMHRKSTDGRCEAPGSELLARHRYA